MFIITGLLLYTGARITEIMSLLEENINLEHHLIFNLIKRTKYKSKYGVYFFPEFFIKHIKLYLDEKKVIHPDKPYMFPGKKEREKQYLSVRYVQQGLDKASEILQITAKHSPHKFRKLINEERRKKGVAPLDRTILLNHTPRSIEARYYLPSLKQIQDLKLIYDKTFPFSVFKPKKI
jgi:integrase